jgi:hypothetical protein
MRAALFIPLFFLAGCATEPVPYHSGNEIPRGPGLLTGPQGEFVLNADDYREYQEWRARKREQESKQ